MEEQVMITMNSTAHDGVTNSFALTHAERLLSKQHPYLEWELPEDSAYKFENGKLILKANPEA